MIPTNRFIYIITAGALLIGFSGHISILMPVGTAIISTAVIALFFDYFRLRRCINIDVTRICDEKLSLNAENPIKILIRNRSYIKITGTLRDEYPEGTEAKGNVAPICISPRADLELTYTITPPKRGDFVFADTYVRISGTLGLSLMQLKFNTSKHIKVYPNMLDMRKYEIGLKREKPVQPGQKAVRIYGRGTDFESLREYVPNDEYRAIDWKASARRGKMITRHYESEKSQNVILVMDCGRIMGPIVSGLTKLDHSINTAMMLAHVAAIKGDKVGIMAFAEDIISFIPPKSGRSQTLNLLRLTYNLKDADGDSNYYKSVPYLSKRWTRRSLVVFFTDLIDQQSSKPLISQINSISKKHLCVCVSIADPDVLKAAKISPEDQSDAFNCAAARQVLQARKLAAAKLMRAGAIVIDVPPEKLTSSLINQYLNIKSSSRL